MELSTQQKEALAAVERWLDAPDRPLFKLQGYAGTGKTTIAREVEARGGGRVAYAAYTGKAASVMRSKGCAGATTIHKLIYIPKDKSRARLRELQEELAGTEDLIVRARLERAIYEEQQRLRRPGFVLNSESPVRQNDLLVLDESSMIGRALADDIASFGVKVLALGDPAQLPPVGDSGAYNGEGDFLLTEVHRQAAGSPVIQLATDVRSGRELQYGDYGESRVVRKGVLKIEDVAKFDQVIVGKNDSRRSINRQIRRHLGFASELPVAGDRVVCLRNNADIGICNGEQFTVESCTPEELDERWVQLRLRDAQGGTFSTHAWKCSFTGEGEPPPYEVRDADQFDFGYALTCHKAQGSQWDRVLVIDESFVFRQDARLWLYTAITRAARSVVVVR